MAAALECWSSRASTDEDMVEQVLMKTQSRSEVFSTPNSSNAAAAASAASKDPSSSSTAAATMQKKWQRLGRNVAEAITNLRNSLNLDTARDPTGRIDSSRKLVWSGVVRNLTQLYPGSQLPEKLISNIRKHFDSLPLSYAQAGFEMKDIFLHMRLIEQAAGDDRPAILIQEMSDGEMHGSVFKFTFVCNSVISWPALSGSLDTASVCCKKVQMFEKKGSTLGIVLVLVQSGQEKFFKNRIETALKLALRKPKSAPMKLPFGLCGCQEENAGAPAEVEIYGDDDRSCDHGVESSNPTFQIPGQLPTSLFVVSIDEWQTVRSGGEEIGKWLLNPDQIEFTDPIAPNSFKGVYKSRRVAINKVRGCERGNTYEIELRRDLLELMSCGHKNILKFHGICIDENHGLCIVTKMMEGGSVHDMIQKNKKIPIKEIMRIAVDVAEGLMFMNDHGVAYRDLNTQRILLDRQGNACIGDMGVVTTSKNASEVMEYETAGYQWLAPEIIAGDPESVTETWMSNVYSFGMVIWEMVTGEAAYATYSPVQAAVGIAACGLRPDIPKDCPQVLRSLMTKCWNSCPSKRPQFSEILSILLRPSSW